PDVVFGLSELSERMLIKLANLFSGNSQKNGANIECLMKTKGNDAARFLALAITKHREFGECFSHLMRYFAGCDDGTDVVKMLMGSGDAKITKQIIHELFWHINTEPKSIEGASYVLMVIADDMKLVGIIPIEKMVKVLENKKKLSYDTLAKLSAVVREMAAQKVKIEPLIPITIEMLDGLPPIFMNAAFALDYAAKNKENVPFRSLEKARKIKGPE
ncbi:hypothetical protein KJ780_04530, partial [Candidatus Micrarchaeota archaeon]|nr:hypothetical protein [Candidatus Micrarchaeota archaeon]